MQLAHDIPVVSDSAHLLDRVHEIGRHVVRRWAGEVDRDGRFPSEAMAALREARLLAAYVPRDLGGMGLDLGRIAKICETLGQYDGSVAMIYAMHQIQVACLVHHAAQTRYFRGYLRDVATDQRLIASATTEIGTGGDLRSSVCALEADGERFEVVKKAPVISYGAEADDILVTCRRTAKSPASDQVAALVRRDGYRLEQVSGWDALGFRGTSSAGFVLRASGSMEQVLPAPFSDVLARTMHPVSHILWSSLWLGIATDALNRAHACMLARRGPGAPPAAPLRLAEAQSMLQNMRGNIALELADYERVRASRPGTLEESFDFAIRINNLKLACSTLVVDIVSRAMLICGIEGYRNDSRFSLSRHLRDAYGAAVMVNNDRIADHNATMLMSQREAACV